MQTTGKQSYKTYQCPRCNHEESHKTNHFGKIYVKCNGCSWKNPLNPIVAMVCQDPIPNGWDVPPEWEFKAI